MPTGVGLFQRQFLVLTAVLSCICTDQQDPAHSTHELARFGRKEQEPDIRTVS